jgi:hypothetical protein
MTLKNAIAALQASIEIETIPACKAKEEEALKKYEEAWACWLQPGKQVKAMKLEEEGNEILRSLGESIP